MKVPMFLKYLKARWKDIYTIFSFIIGIILVVCGCILNTASLILIGLTLAGSVWLGTAILAISLRVYNDYSKWKEKQESE